MMKLSFNPQDWKKDSKPSATAQQLLAEPVVVFEDDSLLVVEKPAGLPVQPDQVGSVNLLGQLNLQRPDTSLFLVHRLDRPVSGLVVMAKSARVQTALTRQMSRGDFRKTYWVIVENGPDLDHGSLTDLLLKQERLNVSRVVEATAASPQAREARLTFQVLDRMTWEGHRLCLMQIILDTGRHHQIRVQLSHAGWPIIGDRKYAAHLVGLANLIGTANQVGLGQSSIALHACEIRLNHPESGKSLHFQASIPADWPWNLFDLSRRFCAQPDKL
jgi:23S rRNA pseudouridine1911/1915/1917 synthase